MHIGILQFELLIRGAESIKDKRRVVKSVKDRLHREHMVSVAEVGLLDSMGAARLGLAAVSADAKYLASVLDRVVEKLRNLGDAELGDVSREILHGDQLVGEFTAEEGTPLWTPEEARDAGEGDEEGGCRVVGPGGSRADDRRCSLLFSLAWTLERSDLFPVSSHSVPATNQDSRPYPTPCPAATNRSTRCFRRPCRSTSRGG